jgi:GAF domain-containing protein
MERLVEETRRYSRELLVEHEKLRAHTLALETQRARLEEELLTASQRNTRLTLLCGASYRLFHGRFDRGEVLLRIREVVADVVGSEEIAVFVLAADRAVLRLEQSFGAAGVPAEIPVGAGRIGRSVERNEIWFAGRSSGDPLSGEADLQASIPLVVEGRPIGALAIFRLLPQKPRLEAHDLDTFELLATQAGAALHCASLLARDPGATFS